MIEKNSTTPPVTSRRIGAQASTMETRTQASERPTEGAVYTASVVSTDIGMRKLAVKTNSGDIIPNCTMMSDSLASMLGFSQIGLPPVGSDVLLVYTPKGSYVCGGSPTNISSPEEYSAPLAGEYDQEHVSDKAVGVRRSEEDESPGYGYQAPQDIMPGEYGIENNMGIFFRMLQNFAQLGAGDLAKIECHLMNDMVRIVDNYFAHHNVGGDTFIWSNGRCNSERHFTSYPGEAEGGNTESGPGAEGKGENVYGFRDDDHNKTGKWRFSEFIGFLGDFIHLWITEPTDAESTYDPDGRRKGKLRVWHGNDGTFLVQSNAGIHLSVSPRIVIPIIKYKWDDPEHDARKLIDNLNEKYTKVWKGDKSNARAMVWQMRRYTKYLCLYHSLERWLQMRDNEWVDILPEDDSKCGTTDNKEPDKDSTEYTGQASISITPAGDISLEANGIDNDGVSSVILSHGNIQIAAANNIEMVAGGMISLTSKNISCKATNNVEAVAICGNLFLKARTALQALCEKGLVWIRSNKHHDEGATPEPWCGGDSAPPAPKDSGRYGIKLEATDTPILVTGWRGIVNRTKEDDAHIWLFTEKNSDVRIAANRSGQVKIRGEEKVTIEAGNKFKVRTEKAVITGPLNVENSIYLNQGNISLKHNLTAGGSISCNGMVSNMSGGELTKMNQKIKPIIPSDTSNEEEELRELKQDPEEGSENEEWRLYDWTTSGESYVEYRSLKQTPYHAAYEEGGKQGEAQVTLTGLVDWALADTLGKDWKPINSRPWPGNAAKLVKSSNVGKPLGDNWTREYTSSDIGGDSKRVKSEYTWRIQATD